MNWKSIAVLVIFMFFRMMCSSNSFTESKSKRCLDQCRCFKSTVDCSGTNISTRDIYDVPNKTKVLNLSNTVLTSLPNGIFSKLRVLHVLDLFNSSLSNMSKNSFKGLKQLKYLNISKNDNIPLTCNTVDSSLFNDLTQLVELRIYGTTTANLPLNYSYPNEALSKLTSLESLWIDGMSNRSLGMELTNLTKLRTLRFPGDRVGFGFCNIDTLKSDMFTGVSGITHLYIIDCGIQILESDVFKGLKNLEFLDLSENICLQLDQVSHAFKDLSFVNLSVLVLNHIYPTSSMSCGMEVNRGNIEGFQNLTLRELYLEHNAITKFTKSGFQLLPKTLKHISIKNNEYEPDISLLMFKDLINLQTIDVSYQFFPNDIWSQPSLEVNLQKSTVCRKIPKVGDQSRTFERNYRSVESVKTNIHKEQHSIISKNTFARKEHQASFHICQQPPHKLPPIIPYLPPMLIDLDVSNSKIDIPVYKFRIDVNNVLKRIYAARAMLLCWEGPVYGLNKLEYLDLRGNLCKRVAPTFFSEFRALKVLLVANNLINADVRKDLNGILLQNLTMLEVLDISNNGLTYMPKKFLLSQKNLQTINLSDNQLEDFEVEIGHMGNLSLLNLSHNALPSFSKQLRNDLESIAKRAFVLAGTTLQVDIRSNYIHCYCVNLDFLKWLKRLYENTNSHLNVSVSHCYYEDSRRGRIYNLEYLNIAINYLEKECASKLPLIIGITCGIVVLTNILVGITVYHYRWKLRYWFYVSRNYMAKGKRGGYRKLCNPLKYDVYVPYTTEDKASDFVKEMISHLEEKNGLRICDSERDFVPGQNEYGMIGNAVHASHFIIFLVTKDFKNDDDRWEIAMRFCEQEALVREEKVSYCIFIDGIPDGVSKHKELADIYGFVKANAYLMYPDKQPQKVASFWENCLRVIRQPDLMRDD